MKNFDRLPPMEKVVRNETRFEKPPLGGTFMVLLRNGDDFRGNSKQMAEAERAPGGIEVGKLMPSAAAEARTFSEQQLNTLLQGLSEEERAQLDIVVVASDAVLGRLATADGSTPPPHQRCVETGRFLLEGVEAAMNHHRLSPEQLLNRKFHLGEPGLHPLVLHRIEDMEMRPRTEEYFAFLKEEGKKIGANPWVLFEEDRFKEQREAMGVEGPSEVSARMQKFVERTKKLAGIQHDRNPDRRLLALAVAPRDVVGPWLNIQMSGLPAQGHENPRIENLAGVGVAIDPEGNTTIKIGDKQATL